MFAALTIGHHFSISAFWEAATALNTAAAAAIGSLIIMVLWLDRIGERAFDCA